MRPQYLSLISIITLILSGCATFMQNDPYSVQFQSDKPVNLIIQSKKHVIHFDGSAPETVSLNAQNKGQAQSYSLFISNPGFQPQHQNLQASISPWFWMNIIICGVILTPLGMWIDHKTGSMWSLPQKVELLPLKPNKNKEKSYV